MAGLNGDGRPDTKSVSTHSRPKVAGTIQPSDDVAPNSFNTQPPEGGWVSYLKLKLAFNSVVSTHSRPKVAGLRYLRQQTEQSFQHTAARRWLEFEKLAFNYLVLGFQHTAARRWLAACRADHRHAQNRFNTQPPEGGWNCAAIQARRKLCFNTQPPEGGWSGRCRYSPVSLGFNTQPPEGGWCWTAPVSYRDTSFNTQPPEGGWLGNFLFSHYAQVVSTHSRPKVAGLVAVGCSRQHSFQHTAARRWLVSEPTDTVFPSMFQHTAARRWLVIASDAVWGEVEFQHTAARRWLGQST